MYKLPSPLQISCLHHFRLSSSPLATPSRSFAKLGATSFKLSVKLRTLTLITSPLPLPLSAVPRPRAASFPGTGSVEPGGTSMASDEDYMAFLDKANQDLDDGNALAAKQKEQSNAVFKTVDQGSQAPKVIRDACQDAVYVTDADEPFEEVSLKWSGDGLPDEIEFAKLIKHWDADNADISIMDPVDWDSQGQYTKLIEAVREATKGNDVRVYSVVRDKTRTEYWVVSSEEGRIVGVKALGVES
ncbi:hypothetical protein J3459_011508 [Metarhizium acridum]|uniref:Uncharacterized protein n=1 Tax=Metarhizium acridum (strain CQMa 102) TaxID=655827 RepID=E9E9G3_METAQ|nr:uncharacterized protein MAC_06511 [Metarhizium acridum CQMa 102]EFY87403.1 hypothetical protein MAC_06511 [Metarhizium acridum CQMa 102]KAG8405379.1 hypothetical protein J3458_022037 [Metarhizium acridum]KAG8419160.1 hypothetical protein J3459_011508 [Metarhizium acridum]